jgi:membrane protease YdiL (CAAX protease family)
MSESAVINDLALRVSRPARAAVGAYVAALVAAEALAAFAGPVPAAAAEGALLLILLVHYVVGAGREARALAALALVPVLRLSSLGLATRDHVAFLVISGAPVLLAVVLAARALELPGVLALRELRLRSQWHVAVGVGIVAALAAPALDVVPAVDPHSRVGLALAALAVFVFVGLLEELVFRGLIQGALEPLVGAWSVAAADALFAATYLDSGSAAYTIGMAAFGLACGWWVRRTRSVAGAAVAHGLVAVVLLVSLGGS